MTKANSLSRWLAAAMAALMLLALLPARVWAAESTAYDTDGATAFTFTDSAITAKDGGRYTFAAVTENFTIDKAVITITAEGYHDLTFKLVIDKNGNAVQYWDESGNRKKRIESKINSWQNILKEKGQ